MDGIKNAIREGFQSLVYELSRLLQAQQSAGARTAELERRLSELERRVAELAAQRANV